MMSTPIKGSPDNGCLTGVVHNKSMKFEITKGGGRPTSARLNKARLHGTVATERIANSNEANEKSMIFPLQREQPLLEHESKE